MKVRVVKIHRDKSMLVSMAESIGSKLGTIAAKVNAVQKLTLTSGPGSVRRSNKLMLKAKKFKSDAALAARGASQKLGKIGLQPADSTLTIARNTTYTTGC